MRREGERLAAALLLAHQTELFTFLQARWKDLFGATYDLLLYDLTSTYFEGQMEEAPKAQHGHSRDQRPDCWRHECSGSQGSRRTDVRLQCVHQGVD